MKAQDIIEKLQTSNYKFTLATKIRDEVKQLDDEDLDLLHMELRRELSKPHDTSVIKAVREILRFSNAR
jgi:hypothetical protein